MTATLPQLVAAIDATWPARATRALGPVTLRDGDGGGQRVSAATWDSDAAPDPASLAAAEAEAEMDRPLFMVRPGQDALDAALAARGYRIKDPTRLYHCPAALLTGMPIPRVTAFALWEPLQIMADIWAEGGIGPERLCVMHRVTGPKTALFGRIEDRPGAVAFIALHGRIAMLHALEVRASSRRKGLAQWLMRKAALWACAKGADTLAVLVTEANAPANALYAGLGMTSPGSYHYRIKD